MTSSKQNDAVYYLPKWAGNFIITLLSALVIGMVGMLVNQIHWRSDTDAWRREVAANFQSIAERIEHNKEMREEKISDLRKRIEKLENGQTWKK